MSHTTGYEMRGIRFHIHTFGCQMNEHDSENIAGLLCRMGAAPVQNPDQADLIIINTCAVRKKSEDKLDSLLGRLQTLKTTRNVVIGVFGCVAQLYKTDLLDKHHGVDMVIGPHNYHRLPEILADRLEDKTIAVDWEQGWHDLPYSSAMRESRCSAYVTIMEGCNNRCSYCVVPFTRGEEKCRPQNSILEEIRALAGEKYKEVQLLGQNVNSYRDPLSAGAFPELLRATCRVEGIEWIRFITPHPKNFSPETALIMKTESKVCRQLHLPVQSGSSSVLKRMKRGYHREDYISTIDHLRDMMPDLSLSTDIIVGFPGETEEEFTETLDLLEKIKFTNIFSFRYSPRPGTTASHSEDTVPFEVKKERLLAVQQQQKEIQLSANRAQVGKTIKTLCTGKSKKDPAVLAGRSEGFQVVNFKSDEDVVCRFVDVRITECGPFSLRGVLESVSSP